MISFRDIHRWVKKLCIKSKEGRDSKRQMHFNTDVTHAHKKAKNNPSLISQMISNCLTSFCQTGQLGGLRKKVNKQPCIYYRFLKGKSIDSRA